MVEHLDLLVVVGALLDSATQGMFGRDAKSLRSVHIFKVARVLRVVCVMQRRAFLRLLMTTIAHTTTCLFWSFMLLAFCFYLCALFLVQGMAAYLTNNAHTISQPVMDGIMDNFGTVQRAMLSLFKAGTNGEQWTVYYSQIEATGTMNVFIFILIIGIIHISLLNILTAVFVDQVMKLAQPDREAKATAEQVRVKSEAAELKTLVHSMDKDKSGTISVEEFKMHMADAQVLSYFSALGLDVRDAQLFFEMLRDFSDSKEIAIDAFVEGCMRMKGQATGIDQQTVIMELRRVRKRQEECFKLYHTKLEDVTRRVNMLEGGVDDA